MLGVCGSRRAVTKPGECKEPAKVTDTRVAPRATEPARNSRNIRKIRVATLNVGTLWGRSWQLVDALERRKVSMRCRRRDSPAVEGHSSLLRGRSLRHSRTSWKKKGRPADCASYSPVSTNRSGSVPGRRSSSAIEAPRETEPWMHFAFLDLEKAFDRVPRKVIWYEFRRHGVPEEPIEWVLLLPNKASFHYLSDCISGVRSLLLLWSSIMQFHKVSKRQFIGRYVCR